MTNIIRIKGFNAEGFEVQLEGVDYAILINDVAKYRLKPSPPENPDQTYTHLIETVIACEHYNADGTVTIAIDFYRSMYENTETGQVYFESPVWRYYCDNKEEIAEFEAQSGLKFADLPVRKSDDGLTVAQFKRKKDKAYKFEIAVPTPFQIVATTHFTGRAKKDGTPEKRITRRFAVPKLVDNANYEDSTSPAGDSAPPSTKPAPKAEKAKPQPKTETPPPPPKSQPAPPAQFTPPSWYERIDQMCLAHFGVQIETVGEWMVESKIIANAMTLWNMQEQPVKAAIVRWILASGTKVYTYNVEIKPRPNQPTARILYVDFGFGRGVLYSRELFQNAGVIAEGEWSVMGDYELDPPALIGLKAAKSGNYLEVVTVDKYPDYQAE